MSSKDLLHPPPLKSLTTGFFIEPNVTINYNEKTSDSKMNVIIWIHIFLSYNPF